MKDKKFLILCILAAIWFLVFLGIVAGVRVTNPKVEELISFLVLGWFFYWTISLVRSKPSTAEQTPTQETPNAPKKKKSKSE